MKEIKKRIIVNSSIEKVFKSLSDETEITKWFPDQAKFGKQIGEDVVFRFSKDDGIHDKDYLMEGKITDLIPNKKITYTWNNVDVPNFPKTSVTWLLDKLDDDRTEITLIHSGFGDSDDKLSQKHDNGWSHFLGKLSKHVSSLN